MLADQIVMTANRALENKHVVELQTTGMALSRISYIERVDEDLIRFKYADVKGDNYVPVTTIVRLRVGDVAA